MIENGQTWQYAILITPSMFLLAVTTIAFTREIPVPSFRETTLREVSKYLEEQSGIRLSVNGGIQDRIVYVYWQPQPAESLLTGLANCLDLDLKRGRTDLEWSLTPKPSFEKESANAVAAVIADMQRRAKGASEFVGLDKDYLQRISTTPEALKRQLDGTRKADLYQAALRAPLLVKLLSSDEAILPSLGIDVVQRPTRYIPLDLQKIPSAVDAIGSRSSSKERIAQGFKPICGIDCRVTERGQVVVALDAAFGDLALSLEQFSGAMPEPRPSDNQLSQTILTAKITTPDAPFALRSGEITSAEILPDVARQVGKSIALWCPPLQFGWKGKLPKEFPLSRLLIGPWLTDSSTQATRRQIAFTEKNGWLSTKFTRPIRADYFIDWTSMLPTLRKSRSEGLSLEELMAYAQNLSRKQLDACNDVMAERPLLASEDSALVDGVYLLKAFANLPAKQREGNRVELGYEELPTASKACLVSFVRSARGWPSNLYSWHPDFPSTIRGWKLVAQQGIGEEGSSYLELTLSTPSNSSYKSYRYKIKSHL